MLSLLCVTTSIQTINKQNTIQLKIIPFKNNVLENV